MIMRRGLAGGTETGRRFNTSAAPRQPINGISIEAGALRGSTSGFPESTPASRRANHSSASPDRDDAKPRQRMAKASSGPWPPWPPWWPSVDGRAARVAAGLGSGGGRRAAVVVVEAAAVLAD